MSFFSVEPFSSDEKRVFIDKREVLRLDVIDKECEYGDGRHDW
jgi:hypothetical protein